MFQPLHGLVTVVLDPVDRKTPGGLIMPDNFQGVFLTGVIRGVGIGRRLENGERDALPFTAGDKVLIAQHQDPRNGRPMPYPTLIDEGTTCIICDQSEVLGVVDRVAH